MKKYFFTTAIIMSTFGAFAADGTITGGAGTCTVDVLGVSDNNATANTIATWTLNEYECGAGQYLLNSDGTLECTPCPIGSYCPGGTYTVESENNGKNTCPTDYTSDPGAGMQTQCYTECSINCTQQSVPEHAINVMHGNETADGKLYYGGSCNAVAPVCSMDFKCATGYHKLPDLTDEQIVVLITKMMGVNPEDVTSEMLEQVKQEYLDNWEMFENVALSDPEFQMLMFEIDKIQHPGVSSSGLLMQPYIDLGAEIYAEILSGGRLDNVSLGAVGYVYGKQSNGEDKCSFFSKLGGDIYKSELSAVDCNILFQQNADIKKFHQVAEIGDWFLTIPGRNIVMTGKTECRETEQSSGYYFAYGSKTNVQGIDLSCPMTLETDLTWQDKNDCLSKTLDYAPISGFIMTSAAAYASTQDSYTPASRCEDYNNLFQMVYGKPYITYVCAANKINIDWNPDNGGAHTQNMCTYDGSITVPSDPVKPGYTFMGWKLVESTTTE